MKSILGFLDGAPYLRFLGGETPREPFYLVRQAQKLTTSLKRGLHGARARMLETLFDVAGLATLAELVRPRVKRRGRPPKTPIADEYPDLVARARAAGGLEDEAGALRSAKEDDSGAQNASLFVSAGKKKIAQPLHESQTGEKKIAQPLHESQTGEEKSNNLLTSARRARKKSNNLFTSPACSE